MFCFDDRALTALQHHDRCFACFALLIDLRKRKALTEEGQRTTRAGAPRRIECRRFGRLAHCDSLCQASPSAIERRRRFACFGSQAQKRSSCRLLRLSLRCVGDAAALATRAMRTQSHNGHVDWPGGIVALRGLLRCDDDRLIDALPFDVLAIG